MALTITANHTDGAAQAVERLRDLQRRELRSDLADQDAGTPKQAPSPETGELGFSDGYYRSFLTITTGFGTGAFAKLGVPETQRPADLIDIPWQQLGDSPVVAEQGDVLLQVCSDDVYVCEHVLRRVEHELRDVASLAWVLQGHQRYSTHAGRTNREEGRAFIGFIDGTANLHPRHSEDDARLVFVDPKRVHEYPPLPPAGQGQYAPAPEAVFPPDLRPPPASEPDWTEQGTYVAVRGSVNSLAQWDALTLGEQERTIGRFKYSGASLDLEDDPALVNTEPAFTANQQDVRVGVNSHVRKTNPRTAEDRDRRLFRRGYPMFSQTPERLDRGLLFIAYGRTLSTQFEFIVRAWMTNPNFPTPGSGEDLIRQHDTQVLAGGYYFVPALKSRTQPWSWVLPA